MSNRSEEQSQERRGAGTRGFPLLWLVKHQERVQIPPKERKRKGVAK